MAKNKAEKKASKPGGRRNRTKPPKDLHTSKDDTTEIPAAFTTVFGANDTISSLRKFNTSTKLLGILLAPLVFNLFPARLIYY